MQNRNGAHTVSGGADPDGPDKDRLPLQGVVVCCTSIPPEQRSHMAELAQEMGATHRLDLTSDITHLIVGSIDTEKYKYTAKERQDIKVLRPSWLEAVRDAWIKGGETDVAALEHQHRLPALYGLRICVTGFDIPEQRAELQEVIVANGAEYHGVLSKAVTHLVAAGPKGKKYEFAMQWGVTIVAVEWLRDSLKRGMALDENLFHPTKPVEERGVGAVSLKRVVSLGKRGRESQQDGGRRKLRRTASSRLESQSDDLWADLGKDVDEVVKKQDEEDTRVKAADDAVVEISEQPSDRNTVPSAQIFNPAGGKSTGKRICIHGFDDRKTGILRQYLTSNGAVTISKNEAEKDDSHVTIVLPYDYLEEDLESSLIENKDIVTDFWVEKCLHRKALVDLSTPLCRHFWKGPINGFEKLKICPTSFTGIDLLHFSKVVKLIGASYDEYLKPETSVLVCEEGTVNAEKLRYALERSIPVVSPHWLWESIRESKLLSFSDFTISGAVSSQPHFHHPRMNPRRITSSANSRTKRQLEIQSERQTTSNDNNKPQLSIPTQPLKQLLQQPNTTRKRTTPSPSDLENIPTPTNEKESFVTANPGPDPNPDTNPPSPSQKSKLTAQIADLLAHRKAITTSASTVSTPAPQNPTLLPRHHRPLGRASSNPSSLTTSHGIDPSRPSSATGIVNVPEVLEDDMDFGGLVRVKEVWQPSQVLGYEDPEAMAVREKLMGSLAEIDGAVDPRGLTRVERIGVVQDAGIGRRRGRRR